MPPLLVEAAQGFEWEVEDILDSWWYYNCLQYRVHWRGHPSDLTQKPMVCSFVCATVEIENIEPDKKPEVL